MQLQLPPARSLGTDGLRQMLISTLESLYEDFGWQMREWDKHRQS